MKEAKEKLGIKDDKTLAKWSKESTQKVLEVIKEEFLAMKEEN